MEKQQRAGTFQMITASHAGKTVEYRITPQSNRPELLRARVELATPLRTNNLESPPVFAGSFWYECTKRFVERNRDKAVTKPAARINGIPSQVLEWPVTAREEYGYQAFDGTTDIIAQGGLLRLYTSPEHGYALTRIEYVGHDKRIGVSFDSSDFVDCGNGIFIPRKSIVRYFASSGPGFFQEYLISEVDRINGPFADKEFVIDLSVGTIVSDARNGKSSTWFEIKPDEDAIPGDLNDAITHPRPRFWKRNPTTAILLGVAAGATIVAAALLWRRRRRLGGGST